MPGTNLTREEASERAELVSLESYAVDLDLTCGERVFRSVTAIKFSAQEGASTFLDAITNQIQSITLNGSELDPAEVSDGVRITLDNLQAQNEVVVDAMMNYTNTGEGLHKFIDPVDNEVYLYSQFEVPDTRRMYPTFEQPDLKATFQFTVTAPDYWRVISNMPTPIPEPLDDGKARWVFAPTQRISCYITALIAGPYVGTSSSLVNSEGRTIDLGVYARKSLESALDADYVIDKTKQGFEFFEREFGYPYPFEKYDQVFVPEFNAGAMENAGAVTITDAYVFRSQVPDAMRERRVVTVLHELAHMWFGDLVTMKWWNDLWLNESFAEFMSTLATAEATEWTNNWTTFNASEKSWAYYQDQLPTTHPIVAPIGDLEDVQVNFDGITYAKGASVLRQMVAWVGREEFFKGVNQYFVEHAHGNTVLTDLLSKLSETSGRDLESWSKLWLETAGVNTLKADFSVDENGVFTQFAVTQTAPEDYPTLRPHRLGIGLYSLQAEKLVKTWGVEVDIDGARTEIPELVGRQLGDLVLVNDGDLAYAKLHLDEHSLATAKAHLRDIADPLARGLVWSSLWESTRDAQLPASEYVDIVLANVDTETESTSLRTILGQLRRAASTYAAPQRRGAQQIKVADGLWQLATTAEPSSDAQFQFVKAFSQLATTPAQTSILKGLYDGTQTLPGLTVDTDLKWELLTGLISAGAADRNSAEALLAHDNTASGKQSYARALASIPTVAHKLAMQSNLFLDDSMPNLIVRYTCLGLGNALDPDILTELVQPYFEHIDKLWADRSYAIAESIIDGSFPHALANEKLLSAAEAWLEDESKPAALRRIIIENTAALRRALAAQALDAQVQG